MCLVLLVGLPAVKTGGGLPPLTDREAWRALDSKIHGWRNGEFVEVEEAAGPWVDGDTPPLDYYMCKKRYDDIAGRSRLLHSLCAWWASESLCTRINEDYVCRRFRGDMFLRDERFSEFSAECDTHCFTGVNKIWGSAHGSVPPRPPSVHELQRLARETETELAVSARVSPSAEPTMAAYAGPEASNSRPDSPPPPSPLPLPPPPAPARDMRLRERALALAREKLFGPLVTPPCYMYRPEWTPPADCTCADERWRSEQLAGRDSTRGWGCVGGVDELKRDIDVNEL